MCSVNGCCVVVVLALMTLCAANTATSSEDGGSLLLMDPLATGRPDESAAPILLEQPEDAFVVKSKPATLSCRAAHALQLYFVCNGEAVRQKHHSQHEFVDPMTGIRQLEVKADISRNDVEEYFGSDGYGCECIAWSSFGQVKSRRAKVIVAFIRKHFTEHPYSRSVELERQVELRCLAPEGIPPPEISWMRNGVPIDPKKDLEADILAVRAGRMSPQDFIGAWGRDWREVVADWETFLAEIDPKGLIFDLDPRQRTRTGQAVQEPAQPQTPDEEEPA